jgi:hypothetical protein
MLDSGWRFATFIACCVIDAHTDPLVGSVPKNISLRCVYYFDAYAAALTVPAHSRCKEVAMPPLVTTADPAMPKDPALRTLAEDVLGKLKYSFAVAAAGEADSAPGRLDQHFRAHIATRRPETQARFKDQSRALLQSPKPLRAHEFRRYADVDIQEYRNIGSNKLTERLGKLPLQEAQVKTALQKYTRLLFNLPPGILQPADPDLQAGLAFKEMKLFIKRVKCIEETDEIGDDEVNLGGNATDPKGHTTLIDQFKVNNDFDEGDEVNYGMSKVFHTWKLETKKEGFPYVYGAVIALAEKDDGGFYKFLMELWELVGDEVKAAIEAATGAAIGAAIGAAFAGIGAIIGAVVGAFIGWLISLFDNPDDIIGAKPLLMTLASANKSYYDWAKLTSAQGWTDDLVFKGDGGKYKVDVAYKVFA